jgi:subtilisin family serine protease/sugar lactone lactonase YvrE/phosphodiesterase/alkaline phosphatase D-like protein
LVALAVLALSAPFSASAQDRGVAAASPLEMPSIGSGLPGLHDSGADHVASGPASGERPVGSGPISPPQASLPPGEGRYIVVLKDSVKHPGAVADAQADQREADVGFVYRSALKGYSATMPKDEVEALERDPRVKYVTPDRPVTIASQSTPEGINRVHAATNSSLSIDAQENVEVDADVAIIDTGVDYEHPDLNVVQRVNCVPPGEDWDTEYEYEDCGDGGLDGHGHGTHVAGTAAALDNGIGVVGVAPGARLWAVKVLANRGSGAQSWIVAGVDWVTEHSDEIEVANMSLSCDCSLPALEEAIETSAEAGVVYAVAAGNSTADAKGFSPAKNPDAIAVSALAASDPNTDKNKPFACYAFEDGALADFSNFGKDVDVAAPGTCVYSTLPDGDYGYMDGTSMASPHVAGAAAILASKANPEDLEDVEAIRLAIEEEGSSAWEDTSGDGVKEPLLDVADQTAFVAKGHPVTQAASIASTTKATLRGLVNPGGLATTYYFEYGTSSAYGNKIPASPKTAGSGTEYAAVEEALEGLKGQTLYHYRIVAGNSAGTSYGPDRTFGTTPPTATTELGEVHANDAGLKATINPQGFDTKYHFEYGTTTSYGSRAPLQPQSIGSGTSGVNVSEDINLLTGSKTYHYRLVTTSAAGAVYGADHTFTTSAPDWLKQPAQDEATGHLMYDVSCSSQSDCMAVGYRSVIPPGSLLAQHWNGEKWSVVPVPDPDDKANVAVLTAVSCTAVDWCVASGWYQHGKETKPFIEHWDGSEWSVAWTPPSDGATLTRFENVSCASQKMCVTVGIQAAGAEIHAISGIWDGKEWRNQSMPEPANADYVSALGTGVSCASTSTCVFVGGYRATSGAYHPLAELWDGDSWSIIQEQEPVANSFFYLRSVSCASPDFCVAPVLGGEVEFWDGEEWTAESLPLPVGIEPGFVYNLAVSCSTVSSCMISGTQRTPARSYRFAGERRAPYVAAWNGTKWTVQSSTNPSQEEEPNGMEAELPRISCVSPSSCTGAGWRVAGKTYRALVEHYQAPGPNSETRPATKVTADTAQLNAVVNPGGQSTTYLFEYGTTEEYGTRLTVPAKSIGSGSSDVAVSETTGGLMANTTYHLRVVASNAKGTTYGEDRTFSTPAVPHFFASFGKQGSGSGQLDQPFGAAVDTAGNIWVADTFNHRIQKFNPEGELLVQVGSKGTGSAQFDQPYSLAIDPSGNIWVADSWNNRIQKFNSKGEFLKAIGWGVANGENKFQTCESGCAAGLSGSGTGQLYRPYALTFDSAGNLWVADTSNLRVQKFNSSGQYQAQFGTSWPAADLAVDDRGAIWVAEYNQERVTKFDSKGTRLIEIGGSKGSGDGQFDVPTGLGIDPDGNIWVADSENGRVQGFSPTGEYLIQFGTSGSGDAEFDFPRDVAFGPGGNIWVADSYNDRIQKWSYAPFARTDSASSVNGGSAALNATINPQGNATSYYFEYGTTTSYGTKAPASPQSVGSGFDDVTTSRTVNGLSPATLYHYRVVAEGPYGTLKGKDRTFTTKSVAWADLLAGEGNFTLEGTFAFETEAQGGVACPIVGHLAMESGGNGRIDQVSSGKCETHGFISEACPPSLTGVDVGIDAPMEVIAYKDAEGASHVDVASLAIDYDLAYKTGGSCGYFSVEPSLELIAGEGGGTLSLVVSEGQELDGGVLGYVVPSGTFVVKAGGGNEPWLLRTDAPTGVGASQATMNATINPGGHATSYYFEYGTTTSYGTKIPTTAKAIGSGGSDVAVSQALTELLPGTTYYYRVVAENEYGVVKGLNRSFETLKMPKATTESASSVKGTEATLNGGVTPEGSPTSYYFEYGTTTSYGTKIPTTAKEVGSGGKKVSVNQTPTGLSPNTTYHFRVTATSAAGTVHGEDKTVTTLKVPKATTEAATAIKSNQATLNGSINPEGSATTYYFEYGTTTSYGTKIPVSPGSAGSGSSSSFYNRIPTELSSKTTYHFRLVASSAGGTSYGADKTFITL